MKNSILIDNATYFSFLGLVENGGLDPSSLYNAMKFIEALIIVDELYTSPTLPWTPQPSDRLFSEGICTALTANKIGEDNLRDIFKNAITAASRDAINPTITSLLKIKPEVGRAASIILHEFLEQADDPLSFMDQYSAGVFITDKNSVNHIKALKTGLDQSDSQEKHVAQYLLRTSVAIEIASALGQSGIPYHPHSHRTRYVVSKLECERTNILFSADYLLKFVELEISTRNQEAVLSSEGVFAFPATNTQAPLIATVLSGASHPEEIPIRALEIRNTSEAKRYRQFVAKLLSTFATGDIVARRKAAEELAEAKACLIRELDRLYGKRSASGLTILPFMVEGTVSGLASATFDGYDPKTAIAKAAGKAAEVTAREIGKRLSSAPAAVRKLSLRRRLAFLLRLARQEGGRNEINALLKRTFHRELSSGELSTFLELSQEKPRL
jgi:hypothetical protein